MAWYDDRDNLYYLALALEEEGNTVGSDFIEKPWKWESEWYHLQKHGNLKEFES